MIAPGRPSQGFFFVMGAPKSGTTWMQAMLHAHPQVSCFGEGDFIDYIVHPMETVLRRYNQQLALVSERVYGGDAPYTALEQSDVRGFLRNMIIGLMRRGNPAETLWWGDKTPGYARQIEPLNMLFPRARFIHVVRDPRDTAVSALYHAKRAGFLEDFTGDTERRHALIGNAVQRWRDTVRGVERAMPLLGNRLLQLRYADLVDDRDAQLRRAFAHLEGVSVTDPIIAAVMAQTSFEVMSGGRKPGETDDVSFFRSGTNGQHRTELTAAEIRFIDQNLESEMQGYGF